MSAKNTFEVTYTWPDSGRIEVKYRAKKDSHKEMLFKESVQKLWMIAGGRENSPYDFRYTDYKL